MDINTKDELLSIIQDLQSRLAVVEDAGKKPEEPKEENDPKPEEPKDNQEVESEDEIEKLLNS